MLIVGLLGKIPEGLNSLTGWVCSSVCGAFLLLGIVAAIFAKPYREQHKKERKRAERGEGMSVDELAERLGIASSKLVSFQPRYRPHQIKKRSGGVRRLMVPDQPTKDMQRRVDRKLLAKLAVHPAAVGFRKGKSIVDNARPHVGKRVVIKMDIKEFFTNTGADRIDGYFRRVGWDAEAAALLTKIVTHEGGLPQGAPTSPRLSNLVNYVMDCQVQRWADRRKGSYTRYADDITISFPKDYPRRVRGVVQAVRRIAKRHGYDTHTDRKLHLLRRHQQQRVTGLVVNDKVALPREKRRWLRAVEHRLRTGGEASLTEEQLKGWKALQTMVEQQRDG